MIRDSLTATHSMTAPSNPSDAAAPTPAPLVDEGELFTSRRLRYVPISAPAPGACVAVAPQVRWTRLPMPMELNHINVWLIEVGDGCVIVDTGLNIQMAKDAWLAV